MRALQFHFDWRSLAFRQFWQKWSPACSHSDCSQSPSLWRRLRGQVQGIVVQGSRYCREECAERALADALPRVRGSAPQALAAHRVPLGLVLLSREQLTVEQLRTARAAQLAAGRGRIGEWLLAFGFVSQPQLTAALARQWSCPVLRANSSRLCPSRSPQIPATLLELFGILPIDYIERTRTLHLAFSEGIDHTVMHAVERMLECRAEPCMAAPGFVRDHLRALCGHRGESEVVIPSVADAHELTRIVRSYAMRVAASEIRLAACGPYLWVRLLRPSSKPSSKPIDLLLGSPLDAMAPSLSSPVRLDTAV